MEKGFGIFFLHLILTFIFNVSRYTILQSLSLLVIHKYTAYYLNETSFFLYWQKKKHNEFDPINKLAEFRKTFINLSRNLILTRSPNTGCKSIVVCCGFFFCCYPLLLSFIVSIILVYNSLFFMYITKFHSELFTL